MFSSKSSSGLRNGCPVAVRKGAAATLQKAVDAGISLFAGEAEEARFDAALKDTDAGRLKPIYDHVKSTPALAGAAGGEHAIARLELRSGTRLPLRMLVLLNVQGRKSRFRTPDDLEAIVRENAALGIREFFITDDNIALFVRRRFAASCGRQAR